MQTGREVSLGWLRRLLVATRCPFSPAFPTAPSEQSSGLGLMAMARELLDTKVPVRENKGPESQAAGTSQPSF